MKRFTLLKTMLLLCALIVGSGSAWAKDVPYLALTFPDDNNENNHANNYTSTWTAKTGTFEWSIAKFNNNNWSNGWTYIRCGTGSASTATITTKSAIDKAIRYVAVTVDATKNSSSNKLEVASNADFTENLQTINGEALTTGIVRYNIPEPAENRFYRLTFEQAKGSNGDTQISKIAYCITSSADDAEPAAINTTPTTWNLTSSIVGAFSKKTTNCRVENTLQATDGESNITYMQGKNDELTVNCLNAGGKSTFGTGNNPRYFVLHIAKSGVLSITSYGSKYGNYLIYQNSTNNISTAIKTKVITTSSENLMASGGISIDDGEYVYIGFESQLYTASISWAEADGISFTTTANMDGWRTFYDALQDYEVDANTKIYVAAKSKTENKVTLTEVDKTKIPHGKAVILKTSAGDHKMVLTKTTDAESLGDNVLTVTNGTPVDGYRMGYGNIGGVDKVGFFKYTATAPAAGIVYIDKSNVNASVLSRGLSISFDDDETTGITTVEKTDNTDNAAQKVYNLNGQRIMNPTKGLYIVNGKKVIIK